MKSNMMNNQQFCFLVIFLLVSKQVSVMAQALGPLHTDSRWIVDENGARIKLACTNWAAHLETMVAEGLSKQPLDVISQSIKSMGFNCVRFTWPLYLVTNSSLSSVTVRQSFRSLGLIESMAGFQISNPFLLDLTLIQAFQAVVSNMGDNGLMVILDNHISKPGWCCNNFDGNGFFGDRYFDPNVWIKGLTTMASLFNGTSNVVGMSLRNELRGPKQNVKDWYRYMQQGAEAVHSANPNVIVILSGLNYDRDFDFLKKQPLKLTFTAKLAFEVHWYAFSDGEAWKNGNPNQVCGAVVKNFIRKGVFLLQQGWPVFLSEFGVDQRGTNVNDNRYLNCMFGIAAELDLDWALWILAGSYYLRDGVVSMDETYGVLSWDWRRIRNPSFIHRISSLQSPFQGPGISENTPYKVIFHPATGLCILRKSFEPPELGSCAETEAWSYTAEKTMLLKGTDFCLQADGLGKPAKLGIVCTDPKSKWEMISDSKMHLSTKLSNGTRVCLDIDSDNAIVTNSCKCLSKDRTCDPANQWFKIISSRRTLDSDVKLALPSEKDRLRLKSMGAQFVEKNGL